MIMPKKKKKANDKPKRIRWDRQPLGKMSDRGLAKKLGVTAGIVRGERVKRGIEVASDFSSSKSKHTDWDKQPLGKMFDSDLAKKVGVTGCAVRRARVRRGIPAFQGKRRLPKRKQPEKPKRKPRIGSTGIDWDKEPLGTMPDGDLAFMLGCSPQRVAQVRTDRGIAPYTKKRGVTWTDN